MLDCISTLSSLLATYFYIRLNRISWLVSLIAILLNGYLYWHKGIYAEAGLEVIYFFMTFYGLAKWRKSTNEITTVKPLHCTPVLLLSMAGLLIGAFIYFVLINYTSSTIPLLDALTTTLSLVGQWLMCTKMIATWIIWLITDAIYAYLYLDKQLPFHFSLMFIYCILAVIGYCSWKKTLIGLSDSGNDGQAFVQDNLK